MSVSQQQAEDIARAIKTIVLGWIPAPSAGGAGAIYRYRTWQEPYPRTGSSLKTFALPTSAFPGTVRLWLSLSGGAYSTTPLITELTTPPNRIWPRTAGITSDALADGNLATSSTVGESYVFDLGFPYAITSATWTYAAGADGTAKTVQYQYADDFAGPWTTAATTEIPASGVGPFTTTWADVGEHQYWRIERVDYWGGTTTVNLAEFGLYETETDRILAILTSATYTTSHTLRVDYHEARAYEA